MRVRSKEQYRHTTKGPEVPTIRQTNYVVVNEKKNICKEKGIDNVI